MLADRSDIGEEISRLKIHSVKLRNFLQVRRRKSARSSIFCFRR